MRTKQSTLHKKVAVINLCPVLNRSASQYIYIVALQWFSAETFFVWNGAKIDFSTLFFIIQWIFTMESNEKEIEWNKKNKTEKKQQTNKKNSHTTRKTIIYVSVFFPFFFSFGYDEKTNLIDGISNWRRKIIFIVQLNAMV